MWGRTGSPQHKSRRREFKLTKEAPRKVQFTITCNPSESKVYMIPEEGGTDRVFLGITPFVEQWLDEGNYTFLVERKGWISASLKIEDFKGKYPYLYTRITLVESPPKIIQVQDAAKVFSLQIDSSYEFNKCIYLTMDINLQGLKVTIPTRLKGAGGKRIDGHPIVVHFTYFKEASLQRVLDPDGSGDLSLLLIEDLEKFIFKYYYMHKKDKNSRLDWARLMNPPSILNRNMENRFSRELKQWTKSTVGSHTWLSMSGKQGLSQDTILRGAFSVLEKKPYIFLAWIFFDNVLSGRLESEGLHLKVRKISESFQIR